MITDSEIIKALECCSSNATGNEYCKDCPYNFTEYCGEESAKDTLNLINRQKAEIERLENTLNDVLDRQPLLVERAEKYAKTEAYKELAEELKGCCFDIDTDNINEPTVRILWDAENTIDDVVKELMEGNK